MIAVSKDTYKLQNAPLLSTPQRTLCGPLRKPLNVLGQCWMEFSYKEVSSNQQMFVVEGLRYNILGLPAIKALNLAARLDETTARPTLSQAYIHQNFAKLFQGLGNLGDEYQIQLKPGATPFALFTPRRVPLPLRKSLQGTSANGGHASHPELTSQPPGVQGWLLPQRSRVE